MTFLRRRAARAVLALSVLLSACAPPPPHLARTRALAPGEILGAMSHRKIVEYRPDGTEGILRFYEDGRATYAGAAAQWAAPWRAEGPGVCFDEPRPHCYDLAHEQGRWFVATPREGGAPRRWYEMKRIDEPANVRPDAAGL
ncbi:hypothetical protein [Neomegalonema perideroedes]|uniref:hypothetical protein n=1 Tax=Neomegalonema perideroedes TaxID=217219 RepID=UPI00037340D5|nr:hypothetical protein [Neomegalonema perideroedes]